MVGGCVGIFASSTLSVAVTVPLQLSRAFQGKDWLEIRTSASAKWWVGGWLAG